MNIHFILTLVIIFFTSDSDALFTSASNVEAKGATEEQTKKIATNNSPSVESVINSFSTAITKKDVGLFLTLADPSGLYLVRSFTSGNLGGRGSSLSQKINVNKIDKEFTFPVKEQTPFDLSGLFSSLPIKSFKALPSRTLLPEVETAHYDQWAPLLKKSLANTPAVVEGDPIILSSSTSRYWVYGEAQIIDDILVGGFAVFSLQNNKLSLVAIIELL
ncbi:MAG: hypothetical protein V4660_04560 [Pseudomonadota bacterium]